MTFACHCLPLAVVETNRAVTLCRYPDPDMRMPLLRCVAFAWLLQLQPPALLFGANALTVSPPVSPIRACAPSHAPLTDTDTDTCE